MASYLRKRWRSYQDNKAAREAARKRSEDIDRQLKMQRFWTRSNKHKEILLFGSTRDCTDSFIKKVSSEQRTTHIKDYSKYVCAAVFSLIEMLVMAMSMHKLSYSSSHVQLCGQILSKTEREARHNINGRQRSDIGIFWSDVGVQECFTRLAEFNPGLETMRYFLDNLELVTSSHYSPTEEDLQRPHFTLSGVKQYSVLINNVAFKITAVNSDLLLKRSTRHYFADETVAFICPVDRYIEVLSEVGDKTDNQLDKSLAIFKGLISVRCKSYTGFIVFFMNSDKFAANLSEYNLRDYFPTYQGAQQDIAAARSFIAGLFQSCCLPSHRVFFHHHFVDQDSQILPNCLFGSARDINSGQLLAKYELL